VVVLEVCFLAISVTLVESVVIEIFVDGFGFDMCYVLAVEVLGLNLVLVRFSMVSFGSGMEFGNFGVGKMRVVFIKFTHHGILIRLLMHFSGFPFLIHRLNWCCHVGRRLWFSPFMVVDRFFVMPVLGGTGGERDVGKVLVVHWEGA
jgi:hypothetical protein